ncbi:hypothetical protein PR048_005578 [Dryococelus australis]|uniref:Uncharacterized protein n=1 Tax=Dryococelus australis TaxID=614101 RepID=A0ABQ9I8I9_9NEOP|nr:hypothetical protein PR048_005578 [Dryococelus australis]
MESFHPLNHYVHVKPGLRSVEYSYWSGDTPPEEFCNGNLYFQGASNPVSYKPCQQMIDCIKEDAKLPCSLEKIQACAILREKIYPEFTRLQQHILPAYDGEHDSSSSSSSSLQTFHT